MIESAHNLRNQLKLAQEQLAQRDDEIASLRRNAERQQIIRNEEEANITKVSFLLYFPFFNRRLIRPYEICHYVDQIMTSVDPRLGEFTKTQQIIKLVQRNAELEIELASLKDVTDLKTQLTKKQKVTRKPNKSLTFALK